MKRPLLLPLAITLALGATHALALGLGPVQVKSKLNQPLDAEIPVIQGSAGEADGLLVSLASADDFERVGVSRSRLNVPLEFTVVKGSNGQPLIKVTSKEPVRDSYLDFLVEANWPNGRLLREYTVLLDPPLTAPARRTAAAAPPAAATTQPLREVRRERTPAAEKPSAAPRVAARAAAVPAAAPHNVAKGEYGPVESGETLSAIARSVGADEGANINQMMLALLKANPDAFFKNNVNALKRGAILRIPSAEEIRATGSAREAAAEIHAQIEDWRGGSASPTRVADTGTPVAAPPPAPAAAKAPKAAPATTAREAERLQLVPPKAGKASVALADRPGSGAAAPTATRELKDELARTKEALATREQESSELKSRVRELEDLKGKNDRLISLKDSEIAELQQKLKELREKSATRAEKSVAAAAPAATTPATKVPAEPSSETVVVTPPSTETAKIDKKDIWGDTGAGAAKLPAAPAGPAAKAVEGAMPKVPAGTPAAPEAGTGATVAPSGATVTPLPSTPSTAAGNAAKTTSTSLAKPVTPGPLGSGKSVPGPARVAAPWYEEPWVKPAVLGAGVLLLLLGLLGLRKRAPAVATTRGSIADSFGESPLTDREVAGGTVAEEAASLREQLRDDPENLGLHLELLSVYYAERDIESFEEAAAQMHAHVTDPHQPEWLEAQAMGQELAPHNPLFAGTVAYDDDRSVAHANTEELPALGDRYPAEEEYAFGEAAEDSNEAEDTAASFALPAAADSDFTFDDLPPLEAPPEDFVEATPMVPEPAPLEDDYFPGEDAIGTKLDLAKAYMDMGDPDGARSMLEEVVAEGSDTQKAEAHRLIAELG